MKIEQRKDWQRAAARKRMLAQLRQPGSGEERSVIAGLGAALVRLGVWMKRRVERRKGGLSRVVQNG